MRIWVFMLCCLLTGSAWAQAAIVNNNDINTQLGLLNAIQKDQASQLAEEKAVQQQLQQIIVLLQQQLQQQQYQSKLMQLNAQSGQRAQPQQPQMLPRTQ